jgi:hypothetical protein
MMQKQKGFSAPVLALSVWTAALAEEMQTGISPRGMIIHGAVQALLLNLTHLKVFFRLPGDW